MKIIHALIVSLALCLSACTTPTQIANRDESAGVGQEFSAPYTSVVQAATTALGNQKLKVISSVPGPEETIIAFSKPVSAFSWGENGRVLVKKLGENRTQVFVTSAANLAINVTATSESKFARNIYSEMARLLQGG